MEEYKEISKKTAKSLYEHKKSVFLIPCKIKPENMWLAGCEMKNSGMDFDCFIDMFVKYKCNDQLGDRPAYYIKLK